MDHDPLPGDHPEIGHVSTGALPPDTDVQEQRAYRTSPRPTAQPTAACLLTFSNQARHSSQP
jgi:hypothetical protein